MLVAFNALCFRNADKKSRVMHLLLLQNMRYNLEILMKSGNQFLLSYLCAETIWKVICYRSNHSHILQHCCGLTRQVGITTQPFTHSTAG